jgi:uncharacterized protein (TIGR02268 family)
MSPAPSVPLLALSLLIATGAAAQPAAGRREGGVRLIELDVESSRGPPELRISSNLNTVVLFDTPPSSVEVEEPRRFRRVHVAGDTLLLVPAAGLPVGTRMALTVHFQDGQAPERTVLLLVVDEALAERQVEVHRRPRLRQRESMPVEALHEENQRLRQGLEALREENRRLRQDLAPLLSSRARPGGLGELFAEGPLEAKDLAVRRIDFKSTYLPEQPLQVRAAFAYRLGAQVALLLELENTSRGRPWQVGEAIMEDTEGTRLKTLSVWTEARLGPGERGHIALGAKALRKATRGPFTLRLQDSEGGQNVTLSNIVFP